MKSPQRGRRPLPALCGLAAALWFTPPLPAGAQPKPAAAPAAAPAGTSAQATGPGGVAIGHMSGGTVQVGLDAEQVRRLLAASGKEQERLLRELVTLITRQLNQQAAATAQATQAAQAQGAGYTEGLVQFFFQLMLGKNVPQADWPKTFTELVQRDKDLQARIAETREATVQTSATSSRITQLLDQAEAARRAGQPDVAERRLEEADRLASADAQARRDQAREANRLAAQVRLTRADAAFARLEREQGAELLQGAFDQRPDDITVDTLWWLIRAGDEWQTAGKSARALLAYQRAHRSANAMAAQFPEERAWQREQSVCHDRIGDILRAQGDGPAALKSYQAGLAIAQSLAAADPRNTEWQTDVAVSCWKLASVQMPENSAADRRAWLGQGLTILERLLRENRLTVQQQSWPEMFRKALSELDSAASAR